MGSRSQCREKSIALALPCLAITRAGRLDRFGLPERAGAAIMFGAVIAGLETVKARRGRGIGPPAAILRFPDDRPGRRPIEAVPDRMHPAVPVAGDLADLGRFLERPGFA